MGEVHKLDTSGSMAQLATRISTQLHKRLKLHCVQVGTSVMEFVNAAITEKLDRTQASGQKKKG